MIQQFEYIIHTNNKQLKKYILLLQNNTFGRV